MGKIVAESASSFCQLIVQPHEIHRDYLVWHSQL
jgi:hypothetical protein